MASLGPSVFLLLLGLAAAFLPPRMSRASGWLRPPAARPAATASAGELAPSLEEAVQKRLDELPPETREMVDSLRREQTAMMNPVMKNLMRASSRPSPEETVVSRWAGARAALERAVRTFDKPLRRAVAGVPSALLILGAAALGAGLRGPGRRLADLGSGLARGWLFLFSLFSAGTFVFFNVDLFAACSPALWWAPIAVVLAGAALARAVDLNSPVWNAALMSLLAPVAACGTAFGWAFVRSVVSI